MSEIRVRSEPASQPHPGHPQPGCDPLPGLIRWLREKQQQEKTEREASLSICEDRSN